MRQAGSHPNLFGISSAKKQPLKSQTATPGAVQHLIGVFRQGYERRFRELPVILKSDGPILHSLIKQFGAEKVEQRLQAFLAWDDQFVVDSGFSLRMFHTRWNALAARCVQEQPAGRVQSAEATDAYLRQLKSAAR